MPPEVYIIGLVSSKNLAFFFLSSKINHQTNKFIKRLVLILPEQDIVDPHLNKETEGSYQSLERKHHIAMKFQKVISFSVNYAVLGVFNFDLQAH